MKQWRKTLTGIVLAGGLGTRLAPWTAPKCLIPIRGVPLLYLVLGQLLKHCHEVIVCTGWKADYISRALRYYGSGDVQESKRGENATMLDRIQAAVEDHNVKSDAVVCYGDEWADIDLTQMREQWRKSQTHAAFASTRVGVDGMVREKEFPLLGGSYRLNIGYVMSKADKFKGVCGLSDWLRDCPSTYEHLHEGRRFTVNTLSELEAAEASEDTP